MQDMDKIFVVKEEGKDINSITRTMTWVRAPPVMEVDERVAGTTVEAVLTILRDTVPLQQLTCICSHCSSVASTVTDRIWVG